MIVTREILLSFSIILTVLSCIGSANGWDVCRTRQLGAKRNNHKVKGFMKSNARLIDLGMYQYIMEKNSYNITYSSNCKHVLAICEGIYRASSRKKIE